MKFQVLLDFLLSIFKKFWRVLLGILKILFTLEFSKCATAILAFGFVIIFLHAELDLSFWNRFILYASLALLTISYVVGVFKMKDDAGQWIVLIYIVIFFFSLLAGVAVLKTTGTKLHIPEIQEGTIGFRAWESEVIFKDIKIFYKNKAGIWQEVPQKYVYDPKRWIGNVWRNKNSHLDAASDIFQLTKNEIKLANCGAVFDSKGIFFEDKPKDLRVDAKIKFVRVAKADFVPGCQICLHVYPPKVSLKKKEEVNVSELYLGYEFQFYNPEWSKMWIPALNMQPANLYRDPLFKFKKHGGFDKIECGQKEYGLSALVFQGQAQFKGFDKDNWSITLYEGWMDRGK